VKAIRCGTDKPDDVDDQSSCESLMGGGLEGAPESWFSSLMLLLLVPASAAFTVPC